MSNFIKKDLIVGTLLLLLLLPTLQSYEYSETSKQHDRVKGGLHFVLIHGFGHGAWCWYRVTTLLEAAGHTVTAIDLTSNGINKIVAEMVTTVAQYAYPLTDFLANNVTDSSKVILVGHSLGGSSISYAMELYPEKISLAFFLAAFMPSNNQTFLPPLFQPVFAALLAQKSAVPIFGDGASSAPTSAYINLTQAQAIFYNLSPLQDVYLAYSLLNPTPLKPFQEVLNLTSPNYGSVRRFYIRTPNDRAVIPSLQEMTIEANPPDGVFVVNNSDHSAFFSQPKALADLLMAVACEQTKICT